MLSLMVRCQRRWTKDQTLKVLWISWPNIKIRHISDEICRHTYELFNSSRGLKQHILLQKILALSDLCFRLYSCISLCIRTGLNRSVSLFCCKYCILANLLIAKTTLHPLFLFFPVVLCLPLWFSLFFSAEKRYALCSSGLYGTSCLDVWSTNLWFLCFYLIQKNEVQQLTRVWVRSLQYLTWCAPCVAI